MKYANLIKISVVLLTLLLLCAYNAVYVNPKQLQVRLEKIESDKIPSSFDGFTLGFFSDLHYEKGHEAQFDRLIEAFKEADLDVLLFGGDFIEQYREDILDDEKCFEVSQKLNSIPAPFGKYAVLGNHDFKDELTQEKVIKILEDGGFKVLTNEMTKIYNQENDFIQLVAIETMKRGNPDVLKSFENVDDQMFTLTLTHTPDLFDHFKARSDYALAGHSHGGQVYIPFISKFIVPEGAKEYYHGKYVSDGSILDITNGVGTTKKDIRLNADAEIVIYRLYH